MMRIRLLLVISVASCGLFLGSTAEAGESWLPRISLVPSWAKLPTPPTPEQCWNGLIRSSEELVSSTIAFPGKVLTGTRDLLVPWARPKPKVAVRPQVTGSRGFTTRGATTTRSSSWSMFSIPSWMQKSEPSRPSSTIQDFLAQPRVE